MKKKAIYIIVLVVIIIGVKTSIEVYKYNNYDIKVYYMHPYGEAFDVEYFGMSFSGGSTWFTNKNGNHYALIFDERKQEFMDKVYTYQNQLYEEYVGPAAVSATVRNRDGHTVFTYQGTVTSKQGEVITINQEIELDGVLTENLP